MKVALGAVLFLLVLGLLCAPVKAHVLYLAPHCQGGKVKALYR